MDCGLGLVWFGDVERFGQSHLDIAPRQRRARGPHAGCQVPRAGCGTAHVHAYGRAPSSQWGKRKPWHRIPALMSGNRRFPYAPSGFNGPSMAQSANHVPMSTAPMAAGAHPRRNPEPPWPVVFFPLAPANQGQGRPAPIPPTTQGGALQLCGRMKICGGRQWNSFSRLLRNDLFGSPIHGRAQHPRARYPYSARILNVRRARFHYRPGAILILERHSG